jgi:hypothetical protein
VLSHQQRARTPEQAAQDEGHEDCVVELPQHRDEVRHQVEWKRQVDEGERRGDLPASRHTRVAEQPLEQDRAVGHQPRDHPHVPLARARDQRDHQRRVERDQSADCEEQPVQRCA